MTVGLTSPFGNRAPSRRAQGPTRGDAPRLRAAAGTEHASWCVQHTATGCQGQIFSLPGLGNEAILSIQQFDLPVTQGIVIFGTLSIIIFNLVVDLLYAAIDPRIRLS